jgi:uncharacterized metal-binding protein
MRCGVPLLEDRVAARCTCADGMLVVSLSRGRVLAAERHSMGISNRVELLSAVHAHKIDMLACGGIDETTREELLSASVRIVDNVACSSDQVVAALNNGCLCPGYGFTSPLLSGYTSTSQVSQVVHVPAVSPVDGDFDCLACTDRICLQGENCLGGSREPGGGMTREQIHILEAATDISSEKERRLCRLAELVYFCLEMGYRRIGIAYCIDLEKPARILARVLSRTFETVPACCRIGGHPGNHATIRSGSGSVLLDVPPISCNPVVQAEVLNRRRTDLNVIVGLCLGADCIFANESTAPVTTLFVKDRSLANNPIGALYSDEYLRQSLGSLHLHLNTDRGEERSGTGVSDSISSWEDES